MKSVYAFLITVILAMSLAISACATTAPAPEKAAPKAAESKPIAEKPAEAKPPAKPAEAKPAEAKPAAKPAEAKPAEPSKAKEAAPAKPKELATVKVTVIRSASDAGIYIADEKGFFKDQGIQISYESLPSGSEMIPLLSTGKLDVGGPGINAATFNSFARGIPIKLVADKGSTYKGYSYLAYVLRKDLADSGKIKDWKDWKGLTVALSPPKDATTNAVDLVRGLAKGGLTEKDVKITNINYADMPAAFANKGIDAGILLEPTITQSIAKGLLVRWKTMDEVIPFRQYTAIGYSPDFAKTDTAKRFMVAYLKGVRAYNDAFNKGTDKAGIVSILTKHTNLKDAALWDQIIPPGLHPDGEIALELAKEDLKWFKDKGQVQGEVDFSKLVDTTYVEYALKEMGKYKP